MRYKRQETKFNLPPLLLDNPYAVDAIKTFFGENLDGISVNKVHECTHEQVIPRVVGHFLDSNWSKDDNKICHHNFHYDMLSISKKKC